MGFTSDEGQQRTYTTLGGFFKSRKLDPSLCSGKLASRGASNRDRSFGWARWTLCNPAPSVYPPAWFPHPEDRALMPSRVPRELAFSFAEDVEKCAKCGGRMKLKALVQKPENIVRFLKHLGEPTEPPPLAPARAPPYWQARELRHRPQAQTELFDA